MPRLSGSATSAGRPRTGPTSRPARPARSAPTTERRLRDALARLNPDLPLEALDDAFHKLTRPEGSALEARNRAFHRMLVAGVNVEYCTAGGAIRGDQAAMIDCTKPA